MAALTKNQKDNLYVAGTAFLFLGLLLKMAGFLVQRFGSIAVGLVALCVITVFFWIVPAIKQGKTISRWVYYPFVILVIYYFLPNATKTELKEELTQDRNRLMATASPPPLSRTSSAQVSAEITSDTRCSQQLTWDSVQVMDGATLNIPGSAKAGESIQFCLEGSWPRQWTSMSGQSSFDYFKDSTSNFVCRPEDEKVGKCVAGQYTYPDGVLLPNGVYWKCLYMNEGMKVPCPDQEKPAGSMLVEILSSEGSAVYFNLFTSEHKPGDKVISARLRMPSAGTIRLLPNVPMGNCKKDPQAQGECGPSRPSSLTVYTKIWHQ